MKRDYGGVGTIALRASALLKAMSQDIEDQRKEFNQTEYYQTFTRNAVAKLPKLSRRIVEKAIKEMEDDGYQFNKKQVGNVEQYALTIQNVIDIYAHRKIPKYRDIHKSPYVIFVVNLKGGVSKTVSTVTLAHALRVHQDLLRHDLRILVIDLDPQASSTMFLDHTPGIDSSLKTVAQAMLNDVYTQTILNEVILLTSDLGVDVIR
ncbi:AAA family ATPase, partial [Escherichia coli]|uniref:AAA family ATPase n=1 Tax=Escherichia coli TaxID=562 RepID=UPI00117A30B2